MGKKLRIKTNRGWIGYPGSTIQQNYAEALVHGYLCWEIESKDRFDVKFCALSNPKPYVTIDWQGSQSQTVIAAQQFPKGSRFRIRSPGLLPQKEALALSTNLRQVMQATEVTFKSDGEIDRSSITAGAVNIVKGDLRSSDVLMKLLRDYYKGTGLNESDFDEVHELVKGYIAAASENEEIVRNTKWSIRHLTFDNMFTYGEKNSINFDGMHGITGIFGPNRAGKSSIVGTMMYALFNGTDRGSIKNLHVVNARKPFCYSKVIVNVNGTDYVIERQTTKHENKKGQVHANTSLNIFQIDESGAAQDLAGEDRKDTEKTIRKLLGTPEDFLLTSLSAQDEVKMFISQGSTKRSQIISKFLDLDICDKIYSLANNDVNASKVSLKNLPERDWVALDDISKQRLTEIDSLIKQKNDQVVEGHNNLRQLQHKLESYKDFTPVTRTQVDTQRSRVNTLVTKVDDLTQRLQASKDDLEKSETKLGSITDVLKEHDVGDLRRRLDAYKTLDASVIALRMAHEKEALLVKQQERSLKILDEVPCGDQFPSCKFIKDAHVNKGLIIDQKTKVVTAETRLQQAEQSLDVLKNEKIADKLSKVEQLHSALTRLQATISSKHVEIVKLDSARDAVVQALEPARLKLEELEEALKNDENVEVVATRNKIDDTQVVLKQLDTEKMELATERGMIKSTLDKHVIEQQQRQGVLSKMKAYELVSAAFHRKGIPHVIVSSQLPLINAEIAKILHGIVDFTVELEPDEDSDSMEIYMNYGDSRRLIELGSGMEKMISSLAIRVALINVSSLPKTDIFVIDEGFGALDEATVEACNRLLGALKRYFKTVIVITHVDGVKDAADQIIEITKQEKDARVVYG